MFLVFLLCSFLPSVALRHFTILKYGLFFVRYFGVSVGGCEPRGPLHQFVSAGADDGRPAGRHGGCRRLNTPFVTRLSALPGPGAGPVPAAATHR